MCSKAQEVENEAVYTLATEASISIEEGTKERKKKVAGKSASQNENKERKRKIK